MRAGFYTIVSLLLATGAIILAPAFALANGDDDHSESETTITDAKPVAVDAHGDPGFVESARVLDGLRVDLNVTPRNPIAGESSVLEFYVNERLEGVPVVDPEYEHENFMHIIGVRDDLNELFHVHPQKAPDSSSVWSVEHTFENPGVYKVWSDTKRESGQQTFGHTLISVSGEGNLESEPVEFLENVIVDNYQVALDLHGDLVTGSETEISFIVSDVFGRGVELESYLGADMHLTIIKDDLKVFRHLLSNTRENATDQSTQSYRLIKKVQAHVEDNDLDKAQITFNITFPEEGIYKLFAEFQPQDSESENGEVRVAEFYVNVGPLTSTVIPTAPPGFVGDGHTDHTHEPVVKGPWYQDGRWWGLFLTSILLMIVLSFGVYKYIREE